MGKKGYPAHKAILEPRLNPKGEYRNITYKRSPPIIEARSDMPKNFSIPNQPNVPASSEHHFSKERLIEVPSGIDSNFCHVVTLRPINLKVIPHKLAKETIEKEMIHIFSGL